MITVNVRSLSGRRAGVSCPPDRTLRQLKEELCCRDVAFASCKLYLRASGPHGWLFYLSWRSARETVCHPDVLVTWVVLQGRALPEGATIGSLSLAPGEFLVSNWSWRLLGNTAEQRFPAQ